MRAAYLNQMINLVVGIFMVPLLLRYLDLSDYLLWVIFTTFGGITLQIESSIQVVSVRDIAKQYHAGRTSGVRQAVARARKAYFALAAGVMLPVCIGGALYLSWIVNAKVSRHWGAAWLLFTCAYAVNYFFGANNCVLLASNKVETFNYIGSLTRALNFLGTLALLIAGYSVMGICISFAASVALGCALIAVAARRSLRGAIFADVDLPSAPDRDGLKAADIWKYTLYTFSAFALYKGGVLAATSFFPRDTVARYGLTLQAFTMLSAVALVPIQIWLAPLVKAILADDPNAVIREMARIFLYANLVFCAGTAFLALFGNDLLRHIGAKVAFPGTIDVLAVGCAFLLELNLFILINFLVTKRRYAFVNVYVPCAAAGVLCSFVGIWFSNGLLISLIVIPAVLQATVCLPLLLKLFCAELKVTPAAFVARLGQAIMTRI